MEAEIDSLNADLHSERLTLDRKNRVVRYQNGIKHKLYLVNGNPEFFKREPVPLERFVGIVTDFFKRKIGCKLNRLCLDVYPDELAVRIYDGDVPLGRCMEKSSGFRANLRRVNNISRVRFTAFLDLWSEHSPEYTKRSYLYACPAMLSVACFSD